MRRLISLLFAALCAAVLTVSAGAAESSFTLTESTMQETGADILEYLPEQKIFHFTRAGNISVSLPVSGGVYIQTTLGGYRSRSNGVTDNGIDCSCYMQISCLDENGEPLFTRASYTIVNTPGDGKFYRCSLGTDAMYVGLPEEADRISLAIHAENDTVYIKSLNIFSSDTKARDMSWDISWEVNEVGNINAQTRPIDYIIMVCGVFAAALIMFGIRKWRDRIRKGK